jgi:hypothetical protein
MDRPKIQKTLPNCVTWVSARAGCVCPGRHRSRLGRLGTPPPLGTAAMIRPAPATAGGGRGWTAGVIGAWMLGCGFVACSIAGCGPAVATIEGTVRYDGRPVDAGRISFVPLAAGHKAAWGEVREGAYSVAGEPGSYRVEISWPRLTGRTVRGGFSGTDLLPETEEAIPAAYNADSRLSATVAAGANTVDFDLDKRQGIP